MIINHASGLVTYIVTVTPPSGPPPIIVPPPGIITSDNGVAIPVTIRTGAHDQGNPLALKQYGNVVFDIDPGGATTASPVLITCFINGATAVGSTLTVTGTGRQRFPLNLSDIFAYNISFEVTWKASATIRPVLYQYDILYHLEPIDVAHWEARDTSHGLPGWQHIRDMYVALRSSADVVLTMSYDGGVLTQTYRLPSTSGARLKLYVPFTANKFKTVSYSFDIVDATKSFRLYFQDSEVRVKPWLTGLGYKVVKAFGGEDTLATSAVTAQMEGGQ